MKKMVFGFWCLVLGAGCCSFRGADYAPSVEEDFVWSENGAAALAEAWANGADFVARFEFLPGGTSQGELLACRSDNVDKQIWGKEKNFAGGGSYVRKPGMWNFEEVRWIGGRLEVFLNGYLVTALEAADIRGDRAAARWVGFSGSDTYRNMRIRRLPLGATAESEALAQRQEAPEGFETYFNGAREQLGRNWKGVTTEEGFDNPIVRQQASDEKREIMQTIADLAMRQHWSVRDGALHFDGFRGGYSLATKRDYADFELWADWRILSITGDSGLYLRGSPQVQIWDAHNQWHIGSGGLYNNQKNPSRAAKIADRQVGDWNRFHIVMRGERVTVWLNGELVVDNVVLENDWDRSKPIFPKEQIELQCHGDPTEWRNIFIKEL